MSDTLNSDKDEAQTKALEMLCGGILCGILCFLAAHNAAVDLYQIAFLWAATSLLTGVGCIMLLFCGVAEYFGN